MNANVKWPASEVAEAPTVHSIHVNGEAVKVRADTLSALLTELGYGDAKVATALNGDFVPVSRRGETPIRAGDRVEIVAPRQGG